MQDRTQGGFTEGITPEYLEQVEFTSSLRGYDREEVDSLLASVADEIARLQALASQSRAPVQRPYDSLGEEMGALLQHAKDTADEITAKARREAEELRAGAESSAGTLTGDAEREAAGIREQAQRDAITIVQEAEERVEHLKRTETEIRARLRDMSSELQTITQRLEDVGTPPPFGEGIEDEGEEDPLRLDTNEDDEPETIETNVIDAYQPEASPK